LAARARQRVARLQSLGMTQRAIAEAAGVGLATVNRTINDPRAPLGRRVAKALAEARPKLS